MIVMVFNEIDGTFIILFVFLLMLNIFSTKIRMEIL